MRSIDADRLEKVLVIMANQCGGTLDILDISSAIKIAPSVERPHGECNQCRYYDGVRGVPGHAPCWHWNIGGVMWNDYCSRFEKEGDEK